MCAVFRLSQDGESEIPSDCACDVSFVGQSPFFWLHFCPEGIQSDLGLAKKSDPPQAEALDLKLLSEALDLKLLIYSSLICSS